MSAPSVGLAVLLLMMLDYAGRYRMIAVGSPWRPLFWLLPARVRRVVAAGHATAPLSTDFGGERAGLRECRRARERG